MSSGSPTVVSGDEDDDDGDGDSLEIEKEELPYSDDFEQDLRARAVLAGVYCSYGSSRKRSKREENSDRISALPDSVLLHIISFLPIQDSIKTDVLSKRWQYLWTCSPTLDFDFDFSRRFSTRFSKREFVSFVKNTLVLWGSSSNIIRKFRVKFQYTRSDASTVDLWTRFAAKNKVEELDLDLFDRYGNCDFYKLPHHFYSNSSITGLSLTLCQLVPNGFINWRALKHLSIGYVELSEELMQNMLLGSPLLESLELYFFRGIRSLNICSASVKKLVIRDYWSSRSSSDYEDGDTRLDVSGPNLHCLEISGFLRRMKCKLMNVPSLVEANLNFNQTTFDDVGDYKEHQSLVRELLENLKHVPNLGLGDWCIQVLRTLETESLPSPSSMRKNLTLHTHIARRELRVIAYLLESSPYLETLVIKMDPPYKYAFGSRFIRDHDNYNATTFWTSEKRTSMCLVLHLRTVRIFAFDEGSCIFDFLKFLLLKACVLQRMTIHAPKPYCSSSRRSFHSAQRLFSFPRSSPHVVVILD